MTTVEKVTQTNQEQIVKYLGSNVIENVFAFYDIQYEFERTTMHVARKNKKIVGYVLVYDATDFPSVILECQKEVADKLLHYAPQNNFIMHTSPKHLQTVVKKFPSAKAYVENWMLVKKSEAKSFRSKMVRKLRTAEDAAMLAKLLMRREDRPKRHLKKYRDWIARMPLYGVFENGKLVSYAGSFVKLPQLWMIGGVYTSPEKRNMGYALLATSAVTQEALKKSDAAALFVRSDNYPAMKVYEKIGYRKIGERIWVDVGTGMMP
jgi:predicted GNAT family acetyltransferase